MPQLLFTAFSTRADALELAEEASQILASSDVECAVHLLDAQEAPSLSADTLVVSLGGDGTFLQSARLAHRSGSRVLAVNLGRLGFLLNVPPNEIVASVLCALEATQDVERLALSITMPNGAKDEFALNEVVVERAHAGHMVRVKTFVGDDEFLTYSADGVMVATPTGSTGYNFSAGGPVIDATLSVMVLTPIAPHFTIDRSIVVGGETTLRLVADDKPAIVVADGHTVGALQPGESVLIRRNPTPVRVAATRSFELVYRLRESLREGHA